MEVPVVCTFAGRDPDKSVADNIPLFKEVFLRFCDEAEKRNIRIAIENCPMMDRISMKGINIAFSPEIWDAMFEAVPSDMLGIEMDPSHMVWQGIDYIQAIYDYGDRIFHVHAKDMEIRHDVLERVGIYGQCFGSLAGLSHGWWYPRLPGWGDIDWPGFFTALIEVGYESHIDIEFEDTVLSTIGVFGEWVVGSGVIEHYGEQNEALHLAYKALARYLP
jgi:sugar phosphate isomerase/epimerase